MAAYKGRRWLPDNRTFDDYEGGPTIEMLRPPSNVHPTMIYHSARMELSASLGDLGRPWVPDRVTGAYSLDRTGGSEGRQWCKNQNNADMAMILFWILTAYLDDEDIAIAWDHRSQKRMHMNQEAGQNGCLYEFKMDSIPHLCIGRISSCLAGIHETIAPGGQIQEQGWIWNDGRKGDSKIIPLSNDDFLEVQHVWVMLLRAGGKGIKLITKDGQRGRFQGPEDALLHNLPDLDWNHMMDRDTWRIIDVPVVDFGDWMHWRLPSEQAGITKASCITTTLSHDMVHSRQRCSGSDVSRTHVAFRSAYNLYYEAVRTTNNQAKPMACEMNTGQVGRLPDSFLESVMSKAEEYLRSDPVLWIPSEVWFGFPGKTASSITCCAPQPPTPIVFDSHLRESLALLEYRNVLETAGMFFLQDFDLANDTCLYDVQQQDDITVLALMGANTKVQRASRTAARLEISRADAESESEEFPLGRRPSWARLKHLWLMLKDEIFQGIRPCPESLQEAMKCWTTTSITDTLAAVTFDACNIGLQDHTGVTLDVWAQGLNHLHTGCPSFSQSPELLKKGGSQWFSLWTGEGYIAEFHRLLKGMDDDEKTLLQDGLADIFSNLHCLPASTAAAVWRVKQSAIVFVTNPAFYKIECLGRAGESRRGPVVRRPVNVIKGKRIFTADLMDVMPFDALGALRKQSDRQKRRDLHKKLTKANKHKRVPPPPRSRTRSRPFPLSSPNPTYRAIINMDNKVKRPEFFPEWTTILDYLATGYIFKGIALCGTGGTARKHWT
ncbi:hypothetical protein F4604DRAFT_1681273 [Suillus subluteus]|nr:hypothetical protein F4604DRAFT_1681273 [Suillus subluteus]